MNYRIKATLTASALIVGSSMVGCSGASLDRRPEISAAQAPGSASRVEKALASKDFARALIDAEKLVALSPEDAGYRALLGRAYLANGRYIAARTAFADAMTLGNRDVRTIVSLALTDTGVGNSERARQFLSENIGNLPAGDYGLAMAIAGDPQEGVRALLEAVNMADATPQTRQNLAYAFALSGDWAQAQLTAAKDMDGATVQERLSQWSQAARPGAEPFRVAALIGVMPRLDDGGMPTYLALRAGARAPIQQAAAGSLIDQAKADLVQDAPTQLAAAEPTAEVHTEPTTEASPELLAAAFDQAKPMAVSRGPSEPLRAAMKAAFVSKSRALEDFNKNVPAPVPAEQASDWVVQLGAYDSHAVATDKWKHIKKARPGISGFAVVNSTIDLKGRVFHRLAIRGFGDRSNATALCASMRANGQACFVRTDDRASAGMLARAAKPAAATPRTASAAGASLTRAKGAAPRQIASR